MSDSSRGGKLTAMRTRLAASMAAAALIAAALTADAGLGAPTADGDYTKARSSAKRAAHDGPADTVLRNGFIYTVDPGDPADRVASAIAIRKGKIIFVGSDSQVDRYIGRRTAVTDLEGKMVMPGLHDAHIHGVTVGNPFCDLEYAPMTQEEFVARTEACLADSRFGSAPDDWLSARNWYLQFTQPPGTEFTKAVLDAIDTERPIVVRNWDGHTSLANSRALEIAGIDASTPDPPDGVIERDENGEPTGILQDGAQGLVSSHIPPGPPVDPVEAARAGQMVLSQEGITSFNVPGTSESGAAAFEELRRQGALTARAHFQMRTSSEEVDDPATVLARVRGARRNLERIAWLPRQVYDWRPDQRLQGPRLVAEPGVSIDGIKVFLDGVIQAPAQTAAVLEPYLDENGVPRTDEGARGQLYVDNPGLGRLIARVERAGVQTHLHTDGDRATRTGLDAVEMARQSNGFVDDRPELAHNELSHPDDWPRFAQLDALPIMSFQWGKPGPDNIDSVKPYVSPETWDTLEAFGGMHAAGARIAYGSDYPVDPLNEWLAIEVAVLREADWAEDFPEFEFPKYDGTLNADPGLSLSQSIRAITLNSAYAMHQDEVTGSLEEGKLADLIVLDRNLFEIPLDDISETNVLLTMVGGKEVWVDPSF